MGRTKVINDELKLPKLAIYLLGMSAAYRGIGLTRGTLRRLRRNRFLVLLFILATSMIFIRSAQADDRPIFLANGQRNLAILPGESITYTWRLPNVTAVTSTYKMNKPDTCERNGATNAEGPFPWVANTPTGRTTAEVARCQGGVTYNITIQGKTNSGETVEAKVNVKVLAPALLANGERVLTASVGQTIAYVWAAPEGATETTSFYRVNRSDRCKNKAGKLYPWVAQSGLGSESAVVAECQRGRIYTIYYQIKNSKGETERVAIKVRVRR